MSVINFQNVQPVNQRLLVEKLNDNAGANDKTVKGAGGQNLKLVIFTGNGNYMRVKVHKVSTGTAEYPMIYKPGDIVVIPRMGIKADYTIDGKEYTFISMHDIIAIERPEQTFSEQLAETAAKSLGQQARPLKCDHVWDIKEPKSTNAMTSVSYAFCTKCGISSKNCN